MTDSSLDKLQQASALVDGIANGITAYLKQLEATQDALKSLEGQRSTLTVLKGEFDKLRPLVESVSHDVAWREALAPVQPDSSRPPVLDGYFDPFGLAKTPGFKPKPRSAGTYLTGVLVNYPTTPPPDSADSDNLTLQAVKLLRDGQSYLAVIQTLVAKYPSMKRDNIRRAVGRARDKELAR